MALGLGEGGEQNAPLGRAVIGGLIFATVATLFFVPTVFMIIRRRTHLQTTESSPEPAFGPEAGPAELADILFHLYFLSQDTKQAISII
jgi:hypothetical protein